MPTTTQIRESAEALRNQWKREHDTIVSRGLIPEIEAAELGESWLAIQGKLDVLRKQFEVAVAAEGHDLSRRVLGADDLRAPGADPAMHAVSFRDAQDRADGVDGEARLMSLLQRAMDSGDVLLARACAARAARQGWREVVKAYDDQHPGWADRVEDARREQAGFLRGAGMSMLFGIRKPLAFAGKSAALISMMVDTNRANAVAESNRRRYTV